MFKICRTSTDNLLHSGRPKTDSHVQNVMEVHKKILDYRQVRPKEIASELKICLERIHTIIHKEITMKKL